MSSDLVTVEIVRQVAAATERDATNLPPLYETVDTGALEALIKSLSGDGSVTFPYLDFMVHVSATGTVTLVQKS
jgi:hypothetical protein